MVIVNKKKKTIIIQIIFLHKLIIICLYSLKLLQNDNFFV